MNHQDIKNQEEASIHEILRTAGISISVGKRLPKMFVKGFGAQERWGVDFNRFSWTLETLITSKIYNAAPLTEFAFVNPTTDISLKDNEHVTFVPMEAVSGKDGIIFAPEVRALKEVKAGYTRFKEGDVLWAKITPCMQNGKSAVANNLKNGVGFGSTEFHTIRSKDGTSLRNDFIHLLLRLPEIRAAATRYFVGSAGQQRVPKDFLEGLYIPIPPIQVQSDIVKMNAEARKRIAAARRSIDSAGHEAKWEIEKMVLGARTVEMH